MPLVQVPTAAFDAEAMAMYENGRITLCVDIKGEPVAQQRVRSRYLRSLQRIVHYDPCKALKKAFIGAVRCALGDIGLPGCVFPIFEDAPLKMTVTFRVGNAMKDFDNLLKFASDALQMIFYRNDRFIYKVVGEKIPVMESYSTSIKIAYA